MAQQSNPSILQLIGGIGGIAAGVAGATAAPANAPANKPQAAKPTFWDKLAGGINSVTSKISWGSIDTKSSVDEKTLLTIGAIILAAVFLFKRK